MVCYYAVYLLGHCHIPATEARLYVYRGDVELYGGQRTREGRVGVAVDYYPIGTFIQQYPLYPLKHPPRLFALGARTHPEVVLGSWDAELFKEQVRHVTVVVLPGVQYYVLSH